MLATVAMVLAHGDPAKGAPLEDLVPAVIVGAAGLAVLLALGRAHRHGRFGGFRALASSASRVPGLRGLPGWASLPVALTSLSLVTAVFGFYWDVSTHIDNGRDAGPFANPSHYFILAGLAGIAVAGYLGLLLAGRRRPVGAVLLTACGAIALAGFPLDDIWHRIFGQDVTLWGPTHVQMVAGASLATLAMWALYVEAVRDTPAAHRRAVELGFAAAFLVGLATLQGEFDFGVPQFRLLYQPVLIALAAGIGLVTARVRIGRGGALAAALGFIVIRGLLAVVVGPVLGRTTPHFPLFLVDALVVEAVALAVPRARPVVLGVVSGMGIGTLGLAASWGWSQVWMPLPWRSDFLAEAVVWALVAAVAGGAVGGLIGRALAADRVPAGPVPRWAGALAGAAAIVAVAWPMPVHGGGGAVVHVQLRDVHPAPERAVEATIRVDGADPSHAAFFNVTAWQGAAWTRQQVVIDPLEQISAGVWRTTRPIPVHGEWKAIVRYHDGRTLAAAPIYLPEDEAIPAPEVPATASFTRPLVPDRQILQREFVGGPAWLQLVAYTVLLAIAGGWIAIIAWGLGRLATAGRPTAPVQAEAELRRTAVAAGRPG